MSLFYCFFLRFPMIVDISCLAELRMEKSFITRAFFYYHSLNMRAAQALTRQLENVMIKVQCTIKLCPGS